MFCGQMLDTRESIELPDCEYEDLLEVFRFINSDEVELTGSNVVLGKERLGAFTRLEMRRISSIKFGSVQYVCHSSTRSEV